MQTREQVSAEYDVDDYGTIVSPGRFEGEPWWIANVEGWDLDGSGEILSEDGADYASLHDVSDLSPEERAAMDLSASTVAILYTVSDQGFHSVGELSAGDVARVRDQAEENNGPQPGD